MSAKKRVQDDGPRVPGWIVSFSDMVTLLLAFFVLLQSFAKEQDPDLFFAGQGSFRRAIAGMGIPDWLFGKQDRPEFQHAKLRHPVPEDKTKPNRDRILSVEDEEIRLRFQQIQNNLQHEISDVREEVVHVEALPVAFRASPGGALEPADAHGLQRFAQRLKQEFAVRRLSVYVIGVSDEPVDVRSQMVTSARRAAAAEQALRRELGDLVARGSWRLHAWGGGAAVLWRDKLRTGRNVPNVTVLLAVMAEGEDRG